ncbi:MAG: hypothetical protein ABI551_19290 [Polyangiaceae bacterium]
MLGFFFRETMRGSYYLLGAPLEERALEFTLKVETRKILRFARDTTCALHGKVTVEGIASAADLEGTLAFRERRLPYNFTFTGDDGKRYRLRGQKDFNWFAPAESMSTLPITLLDEHNEEIGRAVVRFDLRSDTAKLVKSFRLQLTR